jgi:hypothetical protein
MKVKLTNIGNIVLPLDQVDITVAEPFADFEAFVNFASNFGLTKGPFQFDLLPIFNN